jgi:hypothetical protein
VCDVWVGAGKALSYFSDRLPHSLFFISFCVDFHPFYLPLLSLLCFYVFLTFSSYQLSQFLLRVNLPYIYIFWHRVNSLLLRMSLSLSLSLSIYIYIYIYIYSNRLIFKQYQLLICIEMVVTHFQLAVSWFIFSKPLMGFRYVQAHPQLQLVNRWSMLRQSRFCRTAS